MFEGWCRGLAEMWMGFAWTFSDVELLSDVEPMPESWQYQFMAG